MIGGATDSQMETPMNAALNILSVIAALAATPTWAAAPDEHAGHHPAGATAAVSATPAPKAAEEPGATQGGSMMGRMMHMDAMSCVAIPAARLAALKSDLVLAPAQLPLWNAFADATQAMSQGMGMGMSMGTKHGSGMAKDMPMHPGTAMQKGMPMQRPGQGALMGQAGSLLERLDRHEAMLTVHLDAVRKEKTAVAQLSAAFTSDQRAKFDAATKCQPKHL